MTMRARQWVAALAATMLAAVLTGCAAFQAPGAGPAPQAPAESAAGEAPRAPGRLAAVVALTDRAEAAFRAGRFAEAAATLERALGIDARDADAWLALGWVRRGQGNPAQARVLADRAQRLASSPAIACRAERLARSDATGRAAVAARDRARRECRTERG